VFRLFKQGNVAKLIVAITTSQFSTGAKFTASSITATFYKLNGTNDDLEIDTTIGASGIVTLTADKLGKTGWHTALVDFSAVTAKEYVVVYEATVDSVAAIAEEILDVSAELARLAVCALEATSQEILAQVTGTGNRAITIHVQDAVAAPIADVLVRIGTASVYTNPSGDALFTLDDGDYDVYLRKDFVTFTIPEALTVAGDGTHPYTGTVFAPAVPTAPNTCVVYGVVTDNGPNVVEGTKIFINTVDNGTFAGENKIVKNQETTSAADGTWQLELIRNSELAPNESYQVIMCDTSFKYETTITVPDKDLEKFSAIKGT
jgi:hypothetical protein